ncbi:hypothetical protein ACHWQZ_G005041 [Mnemiopsis leidyi]
MSDLGWTCLVTGANRGLGFEFVKQCVAATQKSGGRAHYVCCCRTPDTATQLHKLIEETSNDKITFSVLKLDVTSKLDRQNVVKFCEVKLRESGLNLLVNNAGIMPHYCSEGLETVEGAELHRTYNNNFIGPTLLTQGLIKLIKLAATKNPHKTKILSISSKSGSVGHKRFMIGGAYDYRCSKVAINRTARNLAAQYGAEGVIALPICPGWAATDMGNRGHLKAEVPVVESIEGVREAIRKATQDTNGLFVDHLGEYPPW